MTRETEENRHEPEPVLERDREPSAEKPEFLSPDQTVELNTKFEEFEAEERVPDVIDVEFVTLSPETQERIESLEAEFTEKADEIHAEAAKTRLEIIQDTALKIAEIFDVHTKAKAMEALLEVIPYTGAVYAVTGRRVRFEESEDVMPKPYLEGMSWTDRGIYLAGEVFVSGHALRGLKEAVLKRGAKTVAKEIGKLLAVRTKDVLVARGTKKAKKQLGLSTE